MRPVGILGGMGPEATILLMQRILAAVPAKDDADHVPLIVHQNPQVPSRIAALIDGAGDDPAPVLADMAQGLERAGAMALAMPCNTAHHYAGAVAGATGLPFLDMLALTAERLSRSGARKIGMLASPATRLTGVFDSYFSSAGLSPVWLTEDAGLLAVIRAVKAGRPTGPLAAGLTESAGQLAAQGADHLLIACTELSLLTGEFTPPVPWTDSLDCLTEAIVRFARG